MGIKIPCKEIKEKNLIKVKESVSKLKRKPKLVTLLCESEASNVYVKNKELAVSEIGANCETYKLVPNITLNALKLIIKNLNESDEVDSILIQLPLYEHLRPYEEELINLIKPEKDIDGFTDANKIKTKEYITPCTVAGILEIFNYYDYSLTGKTVLVIGRGKTCSTPLVKELNLKSATLLWANSKTSTAKLKELIEVADVVVSAVGQESFLITEDYFGKTKKDFLIDVGIVRLPTGKIRGDFDSSSYSKTEYYTTTPGGTGQLTVSFLMNNLLKCYELRNSFETDLKKEFENV